MTPVFAEIWKALLIVGALAATWSIVDGKTLLVYPLIMRYLDLRMWLFQRRLWIRETKRWASTLTGELVDLRQALGLVAQATSGVIRHSLSTRPRYNSPEWQAYRNHLGQRADFANNRWRDGKPPVQPATYFPPWRLSYSGFTRESPPPLGRT